jgi:hypothetical protein
LEIVTQTIAVATDIAGAFSYVGAPALAWPIVIGDMSNEGGASIEGRHNPKKGHAAGVPTLLRQDTYLTGTSGRTGRAFNVVSGTIYSDFRGQYDNFGIGATDSTPGVAWEVVSATTTAQMEPCEIILRRGDLPFGSVGVFNRTNTYTYLHFAYGNRVDYRLAYEYGQPFRLQLTTDTGATWKTVATARDLGSVERYLKAHGDEIRIRFEADYLSGSVWIEIGDGHWLHDAMGTGKVGADPALLLPNPGRIRLIGKNGWMTFEYFPVRHGAVSADKPMSTGLRLASPHPNAASARIVTNGLTKTPDGQNTSYTVNTDGTSFGWSLNASLPDAGEGQGSAFAPVLSDATMLVDEVWYDRVPGDTSLTSQEVYLRAMHCAPCQTFDDNARVLRTSGRLTVNNYDGLYSGGVYGNLALNLFTSVGFGQYVQQLSGVAGVDEEGMKLCRSAGSGLFEIPFSDKRVMMMVPLMTEIILDGWCLYAAIRWLARAGNIHPRYLLSIPYWPDGPADSSCPYPVLPSGTGNNPKLRFTPEAIVWTILQYLTQSAGYPVSPGLSIPYYMGFTPDGQFHFVPYDPLAFPQSAMYTTDSTILDPNSGIFPIVDNLAIYTSTAGLRSEINFQGLDAITFQLKQYHSETSVAVRKALGYRYPWMERKASFGTDEYITGAGDTATQVASQLAQVLMFPAPRVPWLRASQTIVVSDAKDLGRVGTFVVTNIESVEGTKPRNTRYRDGIDIITARNVEGYPSAYGSF